MKIAIIIIIGMYLICSLLFTFLILLISDSESKNDDEPMTMSEFWKLVWFGLRWPRILFLFLRTHISINQPSNKNK